ncbi:DUF1243 domain-containing protein [Shewanella gelidii]|uniref:Ubiquinone biosynthesis accessory factor UbiJ n=2 Tax=Shewanella gelidii TaxID=1642821 RepID=A0A917JWY7_9GAMM|nr:SCP2 sterol-binding domain-containing protein [Shewanella gelidii]GGI88019.1 DUF1243 domain-containing protein [Shewanella gelidii]
MHQQAILLACAAMETGLLQLQQQSPEDYAKLRNLHGKVFCIQLSQLSWPIYLVFAKEMQVLSHYEGDVDVTVSADLTTLYQVTEGANLTELIKQDRLKIEGDLTLLQSFSHYLQQTQFDFAEPLSRYIGDAPTHFLVSGAQAAKSGLNDVFRKSISHMEQLATQEYRVAITPIDLVHFQDQVETLSLATDALEQKIKTLVQADANKKAAL